MLLFLRSSPRAANPQSPISAGSLICSVGLHPTRSDPQSVGSL